MSRLQYNTDIRLIRVMCTGRIDLAFVLRAFRKGADGVLILGCHLNECNYLTHGNFYALSMTGLCQRLLEFVGLNPDRLRADLVSGGEAGRFVEIVDDFSARIRQLGPVGSSEGLERIALDGRLDAVSKRVPYLKLQVHDKLRSRLPSQKAYATLFSRSEVQDLLENVPSFYIDPDRCQACMVCAKRCPVAAIEGGKGRIHVIDQDLCIRCGRCQESCPPRFGAVQRLSGDAPPALPESERQIDRKRPRG